jgi:hypothetical protein
MSRTLIKLGVLAIAAITLLTCDELTASGTIATPSLGTNFPASTTQLHPLYHLDVNFLPSDFFEGLAQAKIGKRHSFIDKRGKIGIPPQFDWADDFLQGGIAIAP